MPLKDLLTGLLTHFCNSTVTYGLLLQFMTATNCYLFYDIHEPFSSFLKSSFHNMLKCLPLWISNNLFITNLKIWSFLYNYRFSYLSYFLYVIIAADFPSLFPILFLKKLLSYASVDIWLCRSVLKTVHKGKVWFKKVQISYRC